MPDISYKIVGACFDVFNEIGPEQKEKFYQKGLRICLKEKDLKFKEQVFLPVFCKGRKIGSQFLDFLVEEQVVVELKVGNSFKRQDFQQVKAYLIEFDKPLGILVRFGKDGVVSCRILKPHQNISSISSQN